MRCLKSDATRRCLIFPVRMERQKRCEDAHRSNDATCSGDSGRGERYPNLGLHCTDAAEASHFLRFPMVETCRRTERAEQSQRRGIASNMKLARLRTARQGARFTCEKLTRWRRVWVRQFSLHRDKFMSWLLWPICPFLPPRP